MFGGDQGAQARSSGGSYTMRMDSFSHVSGSSRRSSAGSYGATWTGRLPTFPAVSDEQGGSPLSSHRFSANNSTENRNSISAWSDFGDSRGSYDHGSSFFATHTVRMLWDGKSKSKIGIRPAAFRKQARKKLTKIHIHLCTRHMIFWTIVLEVKYTRFLILSTRTSQWRTRLGRCARLPTTI